MQPAGARKEQSRDARLRTGRRGMSLAESYLLIVIVAPLTVRLATEPVVVVTPVSVDLKVNLLRARRVAAATHDGHARDHDEEHGEHRLPLPSGRNEEERQEGEHDRAAETHGDGDAVNIFRFRCYGMQKDENVVRVIRPVIDDAKYGIGDESLGTTANERYPEIGVQADSVRMRIDGVPKRETETIGGRHRIHRGAIDKGE